MSTLADGTRIVVVDGLAAWPDHRDDARRIVRHGYAEVLAWLGEDPGPAPGEPTHYVHPVNRPSGLELHVDRAAAASGRVRIRADMRGGPPTWKWIP